jgi:hypothetical protein
MSSATAAGANINTSVMNARNSVRTTVSLGRITYYEML